MIYALTTKKLTKAFGGVRAVDNLSIQIETSKVTGIVGPNGSGKSTLVNVLTGIHRIDSGSVVIGGEKEQEKLKSHHVMHFGLTRTFQNVRLFEQITVLDNILVALTRRDIFGALFERHEDFYEAKAREVLERVGLWSKRESFASELSYGQRKLLEIGRALATDADIILFDEPFAGLFPEMVKLVEDIIKELRAEDKTIVLIEHDMNIIRRLCDRVIVLDAGKLLADGEPNEVLCDSKVIEAYLGK